MSLFRLPRGKLPLTFLTVPAGKDGRVECPCQTFDGFIGIGGSVCGLFLAFSDASCPYSASSFFGLGSFVMLFALK